MKNLEVIEWAVRLFELEAPPIIPDLPEHTWPKYTAAVVLDIAGTRAMEFLRWGIWPFYEKNPNKALTNARDDALLTKPVWQDSAATRRCLIPATGYFEPGQGPEGARGELQFSLHGRPHFFFAGLWDTDPDGSGNRGFTMVTTRPNEYAARFHDRMPVVLSDADAGAWLGSSKLPDQRVRELCRPLPEDALQHIVIPAVPRENRAPRPRTKAAKTEERRDGELPLF